MNGQFHDIFNILNIKKNITKFIHIWYISFKIIYIWLKLKNK